MEHKFFEVSTPITCKSSVVKYFENVDMEVILILFIQRFLSACKMGHRMLDFPRRSPNLENILWGSHSMEHIEVNIVYLAKQQLLL